MSGFRFHAAAPSREWINDPNGLCYQDGRYELFVQHASDAPDFARIGWGRFVSRDLLDWTWTGDALTSDVRGYAYSGSIVRAGTLRAFHTRHDAKTSLQSQHQAELCEGAWHDAGDPVGPSGRNRRDPFVFRHRNGWFMLVAAPCDWSDWPETEPSRIEIWQSQDLADWQGAGAIGPWHAKGILWEVPVLIDLGSVQALIVSLVDRRSGASDCSVHYWTGRFTGATFEPLPGFPQDGLPLDLGPDFYAAIPNLEHGWPDRDRVIVGWASNWRTARKIPWPAEAGGGPISLPRRLSYDAARQRLAFAPIPQARPLAYWRASCSGNFRLRLNRGPLSILVTGQGIDIAVERRGEKILEFSRNYPGLLGPGSDRQFTLFVDGPLLELFIEPEGLAFTAALPSQAAVQADFNM